MVAGKNLRADHREALDEADILPTTWAFMTLAADFAERDEDEAGEGEGDQTGGVEAMKLADLAVEQGEADKDKDDVGAEDLERGLAEGEEGFDQDDACDEPAGPVEEAGEGDEVDEAQGTYVPLSS